jgi:hypothetical protein
MDIFLVIALVFGFSLIPAINQSEEVLSSSSSSMGGVVFALVSLAMVSLLVLTHVWSTFETFCSVVDTSLMKTPVDLRFVVMPARRILSEQCVVL